MTKLTIKSLTLNAALLALLANSAICSAQTYFTSTSGGDVDAGFRKTGTHQENYEMVVYLGNFTNFLAVPSGVTINITNYSTKQLTNMCPDNLANLQWSVFSSFAGSATAGNTLPTTVGVFPAATCFYTVPRTNVSVQTTPVNRFPASNEGTLEQQILSVGAGANSLSTSLGTTNAYNNSLVVLEPLVSGEANTPVNDPYDLSTFIGDQSGNYPTSWGDFGGVTFNSFTVENTTPSPFTSPTVSDFYMNCNVGQSGKRQYTDPITGAQTGSADYIGYFTLATNGLMSFTRAAAVVAPTITADGATGATNGFAGLSVVFTNSTSGTITNYVWNFGNGTIITNTTGANVTNVYSAAGDYTVTLTVYGPGGATTNILANYIVTSPTPRLSSVLVSGGKLYLSGTNGPAGVQYRILSSTNLTTWTPVLTNSISAAGAYGFTNTYSATNKDGFFLLVSP